MKSVSQTPYVFHGGDDDLNRALASLSWRELSIGFGIAISIFLVILLSTIIMTK